MYYYYNYQDAGYPGEPLPDNGGSFPGIFHIVINQSSQKIILFTFQDYKSYSSNNNYVMVTRRPSYWTACHPCPWAVGVKDDDDIKGWWKWTAVHYKSFDDERGRWEWTEDENGELKSFHGFRAYAKTVAFSVRTNVMYDGTLDDDSPVHGSAVRSVRHWHQNSQYQQ